MTRKHFEAIAKRVAQQQAELNQLLADNVITEEQFKVAHLVILSTAHALADDFFEFNHHFDRDKFIKACAA